MYPSKLDKAIFHTCKECLFTKIPVLNTNSIDPDQTLHFAYLIFIYSVCQGTIGLFFVYHMSHVMRKPVFCYMRTTKAQISLCICAV